MSHTGTNMSPNEGPIGDCHCAHCGRKIDDGSDAAPPRAGDVPMVALDLVCAHCNHSFQVLFPKGPDHEVPYGGRADLPDNYPSYGNKSGGPVNALSPKGPDNEVPYGGRSKTPDNYPSYGNKSGVQGRALAPEGPDNYPSYGDKTVKGPGGGTPYSDVGGKAADRVVLCPTCGCFVCKPCGLSAAPCTRRPSPRAR